MGFLSRLFGEKKETPEAAAPMADAPQTVAPSGEAEAAPAAAPEIEEAPMMDESSQVGYADDADDKSAL